MTRGTAVWCRHKAKANRPLGTSPIETRTTHESTCHIPYDVVEIIIAHLTHDLETLKACSLACHSWYTAAVPHLQHTLTLRRDTPSFTHGELDPPSTRDRLRPLSMLHELGLMPLVKEIRVEQWCGSGSWFSPQTFSHRDLGYFSAFTNVHTLRLRGVELNRFIPGVQRYFEHFSPTLRSIVVFNPYCTPQQLSHFLSLFSNLDDVELWHGRGCLSNNTISDTELVPFSAPKLRGRLALRDFRWVETWTHFITSCGGLRFRHIDLCESTSCAPILFKACAETLETLRFRVADGSVSK